MRRVLATLLTTIGISSIAQAQSTEFIEYAGCAEEDFVTLDVQELSIEFQGSSYEPACIKVKAGTSVTLPASKKHPLQAAVDFQEIANPYRSEILEGFLENQTRTLDVPGFYGYYCTRHADPESGRGMGGMIWVVENL